MYTKWNDIEVSCLNNLSKKLIGLLNENNLKYNFLNTVKYDISHGI